MFNQAMPCDRVDPIIINPLAFVRVEIVSTFYALMGYVDMSFKRLTTGDDAENYL